MVAHPGLLRRCPWYLRPLGRVLTQRLNAVPLKVGCVGDRYRISGLQPFEFCHKLLVVVVGAGSESVGQARFRFHLHPEIIVDLDHLAGDRAGLLDDVPLDAHQLPRLARSLPNAAECVRFRRVAKSRC